MRPWTLSLLISFPCLATDPYPRNESIDIQHYSFELELNDSTDVISGSTSVTILFRKSASEVTLNLINKKTDGKGMDVRAVTLSGKPVEFVHRDDLLTVRLPKASREGEKVTVMISYQGVPLDGLIIGTNKFGDRTFFADNWPDRGRHWLPTIDHPSDKATVEFLVIAPEHYQVVATGRLVEESALTHGRKLTHWQERAPVAVKVMAIGVARFAMQLSGKVDSIPVTTWVYPQDRGAGFNDFAVAPRILGFFVEYIGPYAFEKLAHVQSRTRWGGLENAGNIFYFENSVTGNNEREALIAHETAHQWFGNSATEGDWHHVWLSEGFATYFAAMYLEATYGPERLAQELSADRLQVVSYYKRNKGPVVDTTITDINRVLSTNTYQKAGWILHMLRQKLGDESFQKGIRLYYQKFKNSNALTGDFRKAMEETSGVDLSTFFDQWLFKPGHPELKGYWTYDQEKREVVLTLDQVQEGQLFDLGVEVGIESKDQKKVMPVDLRSRSQQIRIPATGKPNKVTLDPNVRLLFEGEIKSK